MKINVTLPFDRLECREEFMNRRAVERIGPALERAGFHGCLVTDHPVPTGRWLDAGGHYAQDPFVMLTWVAAVTKTLRLQTGILVLPYRNPFITARAVATLDVFSEGRVSLGIGAGYLKGEYKALGVDFDSRNDLTDEYLRAMKAAWTNDEFVFGGTGYKAQGNRIIPRPVQKPHPPLLIGGNSKRAIRRAAELGDAWNPFFVSGSVTSTSRTVEMADENDLARGIAYLREHCEKIGRAQPPEVFCASITSMGDADMSPQYLIDKIGGLRRLGVMGGAVNLNADTLSEYCDQAERFGVDVIAKL